MFLLVDLLTENVFDLMLFIVHSYSADIG